MSEDQVVQLKTSLKEIKRIIEEKDIAYDQSASQIQKLENRVVFLRAEVKRVHKILDEGPSASSSVKECLNCAKMLESQKNLGKLIESQKVYKRKAGIGYCPSTEEAKGKAVVKALNVIEKKKNSPQKFYGYCLKCNTYGHKASNCRVMKKSERISINNSSVTRRHQTTHNTPFAEFDCPIEL